MPTIAEAKEAADSGAVQQARLMYETIIQENPRAEDAWLGLADVLTEIEDKRVCYKNVLKINKKNKQAKDGLRSLEPQSDALRQMFDIAPAEEGADEPIYETEDELAEEAQEVRPKKRRKKKQNAATPQSQPAESDTPTPVLVALGLALSLVVFAIGGGVAYFVLTALVDG